MSTFKITRRFYQRAPQHKLATYAENVYNRTKGVAKYESFQALVEAIEEPLEQYKAALLAIENGGKSQILAKNISKQKLIKALDKLVNSLENSEGITAQLIVDAGFTLKSKPIPAFIGKLQSPVVLRAVTTGRLGELKITVKNALPQIVAFHIVEYSTDKGKSWNHVNSYHNKRTFIIDGLPASRELLIRVKALRRNGKQSDWSEPMLVAVL